MAQNRILPNINALLMVLKILETPMEGTHATVFDLHICVCKN